MTAPLTPADADLQDFPFMPLHVARLRDSDLASEEEPEACWYAVLLWAVAWHQLPAGSLPDNDVVLTKLIGLGRDVKTFRKHKAGATRGFVLCDDGRLYHPIVAEQVISSWQGKLKQRWGTECARIKKANQRNETSDPLPTFEEFLAKMSAETSGQRPASVPQDAQECPSGQGVQERETGRGIQERTVSIETAPSGAPPPLEDDLAELRALPIATGSWRLALKVLMDLGGQTEARARPVIGKLKASGLTEDDLWQIAEAAWREKTADPVPYLVKAAENCVARAGGVGVVAPSDARQRVWMAEFVATPNAWRAGDRGPRPGEQGCRVSGAIQQEFGVTPWSEGKAA